MRKIFSILLLTIFIGNKIQAQSEITFLPLSFQELKDKAAKENKLIFIDCYTSWCAPCKWMDKNVFNVPEVANYYNSTFINAHFDMEKGEGVMLRKEYEVQSFPTYLFIDHKGKLIYRSNSKMPVAEFLSVGKKATDPAQSLSALKEAYNKGNRDMKFLLDYYDLMEHSDRTFAAKLNREIMEGFPADKLNTSLGWRAINTLGHSKEDRFGAYFMSHQDEFNAFASQGAIDSLSDRMVSYELYGLMRNGNEQSFREKLRYFKNSQMASRQKQGVMLEADFYLQNKRYDDYMKLVEKAYKGILKDDAERLSFLARRANMRGMGDDALLPIAYKLAKKAARLEPGEYSTQSTLAQICLETGRKKEGLVAANKAMNLAGTTKIEGIVQKLIDRLNALP